MRKRRRRRRKKFYYFEKRPPNKNKENDYLKFMFFAQEYLHITLHNTLDFKRKNSKESRQLSDLFEVFFFYYTKVI